MLWLPIRRYPPLGPYDVPGAAGSLYGSRANRGLRDPRCAAIPDIGSTGPTCYAVEEVSR
jgi:hypothetical protein